MIDVIKNKIVVVVAALLLLVAFVPVPASAQDTQLEPDKNARCGSNIGLGRTCNDDVAGSNTKLENLIKTVINIFSAVVGAVSVIMIIVGGFRYITSGGDSNNVGAAKNTILYAIVGLVIVAIAQIIVQFVLERATT